MNKQRKYLTFFHNSDNYILLFRAQGKPENKDSLVRPSFFWFNDSWFTHNVGGMEKYFYLFVQNPKEKDISFRSRHEGSGFHGLYSHYVDYLKERDVLYVEPSILVSFSDIIPDIIAEYNKATGYHIIDRPLTHQGVKFKLLDDNGAPRTFTEIPEIVSILPKVNNALPFVEPDLTNGVYTYEDFNKFETETDGYWL